MPVGPTRLWFSLSASTSEICVLRWQRDYLGEVDYDRHSRPAPLPGSDSQHEAGRKAYPLVVVSPGHGMQPGVHVIEVGNADCESVVQFDVQSAAGGNRKAG